MSKIKLVFRVVESDVKKFVADRISKPTKFEKYEERGEIIDEYKHSEFGAVETKYLSRIKKIAAPHLTNSWNKIPHVTNHDEADITEMDEFRESLTDIYTGKKKKITPLAFIIKALVSTLKKFPNFNASIDNIEEGKITLKKYFHIGIAVDTPNGLMVPKIRNADIKNIAQLGDELKKVSNDCRELKINKNECMKRVVQRDIKERGKEKKQAEEDFLKSWDIYYQKFKNKNIKNNANAFTITKNTNIDQILKKYLNDF